MGRRHQIFSAISAVFRPILWALGMETPIHEELTTIGGVDTWYRHSLLLCLSYREVRDRFTDPKALPVRRIKIYKEDSLSQHEYIIAEVCPKDCPKVYIKVERLRLAKPNNHVSTTRNSSNLSDSPQRSFTASLASINSLSDASKQASFKGFLADDHASTVTGWPVVKTARARNDGVDLIAEVSFEGTTLYDLIIVAYTLHNYSPAYELLTRQCYWFANLTTRVLEHCDKSSKRSSYLSENAEVLKEGFSGQWHGWQISNVQTTMVKDLEELFVKEQVKFRNVVLEKAREVDGLTLRADTAERNIVAEAERANAAERNIVAEVERANAEAERAKAEAERAKAEAERAKAEAERANAAERNIIAEVERANAEAERANAEAERANAEAERANTEAERANAAERNIAAEAAKNKIAEERIQQLMAQLERAQQSF